ncbi:MAG: HlyD family secretion protein, partial [Anaerolineae bacterium]
MKRFLIIIVVLAVVVGGSWYIYNRVSVNPAALAANTPGETTTRVTKGSIELVVSSTGSLAPERQAALGFTSSGTVNAVSAVKSSRVTAGQTLATLDSTNLQTAVKQAEISLSNAQVTLNKVSQKASADDLAAARLSVQVAQVNLNTLQNAPTPDDAKTAEISVEQAKNSLWIAQSQRDAVKGNSMSTEASKAQADVSVANAEFSVRQAELNYQTVLAGATESQILSAKNQLLQAKNTLAKLEAQPNADDVASAQNQIELATLNLQTAKDNLKNATLSAPFAGLLAGWTVQVGDTVGPATVAGTLIDDSKYHVDISFDETEIANLAETQPATITLDAFPDQVLTGTVTAVDTLGTITQGVVYYNVRVDLNPSQLALRPSMTAAVDIVSQHKDN